jgi:large subunit ribosomal protein L11
MKQQINALVEGGEASAGPPLGPSLGPLGVDIGAVVKVINEKTSSFKGMKVPVKVLVDPETKEFEVEVGSPPMSALIKKELGIDKASKLPGEEAAGNLSIEQAVKLAKMKMGDLLATDLKAAVKEVLGTCNSMGITVEGRRARDLQSEIDSGAYDQLLKG